MKPPKRSLDKWHRLAYELEHDATRMRKAGHQSLAEALKAASTMLGCAVRGVE